MEGDEMVKGHRIAICGAGIAGLTLGKALHNKGIACSIFEKARQSTSRNSYGITLYPKYYQPLLKILKLDEATFRKKIAVDAGSGGSGRIGGSTETGAFKANKNKFESLLAEDLEVKWEHELTTVEPLPGAVEIAFKNHSRHASTYVVGADGPHSQVRHAILPDKEFTILPYATYNGKRRINREDWNKTFASAFEGTNVIEQKVNGTLLQISINSISDEEVSINYVFSRAAKKSGVDALYRPKREKDEAKETPEELFEEIKSLQDQLSSEPFKFVFSSDAMKQDRLLNWLMRSLHVDISELGQAAEEGIVSR